MPPVGLVGYAVCIAQVTHPTEVGAAGKFGRLQNMGRFGNLLCSLAAFAVVASVLLGTPGALFAQEGQEPLQERIDRLIEQLGDVDYSIRQGAQDQLAELGFDAYDALEAATTHEDFEIAARARYLLQLIPAQWSAENEPDEVQKLLTYYQSYPGDIRTPILQELARMPGSVGIPALCRLVRFEKSTEWSKQAAVQILNHEPTDEAGREHWKKTLRENLGRSGRVASRWLSTYLDFNDGPKASLDEWTKLVEAEQAALEKAPDQSSTRVVISLLYHLAMAQDDQGDAELAEKTVQRALALGAGRAESVLRMRLSTAFFLQRRGRFDWAASEYRHIIDANSSAELAIRSQLALSEMWHDFGDDRAAGDALAEILAVEPKQLQLAVHELNKTLGTGRSVPGLRARMCYFRACHFARQGDLAKQREYLDAAIESDPGELDTLIERYRLPGATPEYRKETLDLIQKAASRFRESIVKLQEYPDNSETRPALAMDYNQFAWLIGNTEGDLDEALRYSKKSLELSPDSAAYCDTLAHVYFATGDLENALKYQTKAAQLEPHSGLIKRQLDVFRKALDRKKKEPRG